MNPYLADFVIAFFLLRFSRLWQVIQRTGRGFMRLRIELGLDLGLRRFLALCNQLVNRIERQRRPFVSADLFGDVDVAGLQVFDIDLVGNIISGQFANLLRR